MTNVKLVTLITSVFFAPSLFALHDTALQILRHFKSSPIVFFDTATHTLNTATIENYAVASNELRRLGAIKAVNALDRDAQVRLDRELCDANIVLGDRRLYVQNFLKMVKDKSRELQLEAQENKFNN